MEILLLQDQDDVRERIVFALESQFNAVVHEAKTVTRALELVREHPGTDLMIYDYLAGDPKIFGSLWAALKDIDCILCSQKQGATATKLPGQVRVVGEVSRENMAQGVLDLIRGLSSEGKIAARPPEREYARILTKLLLSVSPLGADIYIRLSETKYLKLFREGDVFDRADLERYTEKKGITHLYLKCENTAPFVDKYRVQLNTLLKAPQTEVETLAKASDQLHETARDLIATVGFTPQVQELAKMQTDLARKVLEKSPRIGELWARLMSSEGKYIHRHSTLCSYVASAIASKMEWGSDTTYQKLSLASFLHDITLASDELARVPNLAGLDAPGVNKYQGFSDREKREYKFHTIQSSEIARQMAQVLPDVDTILLQHHEFPDGSGFPRGLTPTHIHPLASVFIVAHDLVDQMLDGRCALKDYVSQNEARYSGSHFKKILKAVAAL